MKPALMRLVSLVVVLLLASVAEAQVVTANLRGTVRSADDKTPMAEATVTLIHVPSGNTKTTSTGSDGGFAFTGLRVGGPYFLKAEPLGFKSTEVDNIFLSAGKTRDVVMEVRLAEEVIEVKDSAVARNTSGRTVIGAKEIDELPSVSRDPRDFVRRNPEVTVEGSTKALSVGGANTRFNSVTIDGIRQDDDFGSREWLSDAPRPIALSAVEELAVESSPFDVRYGKFLGGNVNIVTKSGTNDFKGQVIGTFSSDALLGDKSRDDEIEVDFREVRYGATVGGPIVRDKLHFLISGEGLDAATPGDVGPRLERANIVSRVSLADMHEAQRIAREVYGFNAGVPARGLDEADLKLLGKLDWEIDPQHRASATYQRTAGNSISNTFFSDSTLPLSSSWYDARDTLHAFSGRVLSDWTDQFSTQLEVGGKIVSSRANPHEGNGFMAAEIESADGGTILLGPDEFRHTNELDNNLFHGKAQANYLLGKNLFTGGIEYEQLRVRNLFIATSNGAAEYDSLADFEPEPERAGVRELGDPRPGGRGRELQYRDRDRLPPGSDPDHPRPVDPGRRSVRDLSRVEEHRGEREFHRALRVLEHGDAVGSQDPDAAARRQLPADQRAQPARRRRPLQRWHPDRVGLEQLHQRRGQHRLGVLGRPAEIGGLDGRNSAGATGMTSP